MKTTGEFVRNYKNKKGNTVFVYRVKGSPADVAAYIKAQGENVRHEDDDASKAPLFFTTRYSGEKISLGLTAAGSVFVDTSALDKAASLAAQFGGNLGTELAKQAAMDILGGKSAPVATPEKEVIASAEGLDQQ